MPDLDAIRARAEAGIGIYEHQDRFTQKACGEAREALDALLAEIERLREALGQIAKWGTKFDARGTHSQRVVDHARAALAPKALPCPHGRPTWRMCPHCLGVGIPRA